MAAREEAIKRALVAFVNVFNRALARIWTSEKKLVMSDSWV